MGAFGKQRDPNIKVDDGEMKLNEVYYVYYFNGFITFLREV